MNSGFTSSSASPSFGDRVRIRSSSETESNGVAGLIGQVFGETMPSVTGVQVIGELTSDFAISVFFEARQESFWFAPALVEFIDHAAGTEITTGDLAKKRIRTETGEWREPATPLETAGIPLKPNKKSVKDILRSPAFMREVAILLFGFAAIAGLFALALLVLRGPGDTDTEAQSTGVWFLVQSLAYVILGIMIRRRSIKVLWLTAVLFTLDTLLAFLLPTGKGLGAMIVGRGLLVYVLIRYVRAQRA